MQAPFETGFGELDETLKIVLAPSLARNGPPKPPLPFGFRWEHVRETGDVIQYCLMSVCRQEIIQSSFVINARSIGFADSGLLPYDELCQLVQHNMQQAVLEVLRRFQTESEALYNCLAACVQYWNQGLEPAIIRQSYREGALQHIPHATPSPNEHVYRQGEIHERTIHDNLTHAYRNLRFITSDPTRDVNVYNIWSNERVAVIRIQDFLTEEQIIANCDQLNEVNSPDRTYNRMWQWATFPNGTIDPAAPLNLNPFPRIRIRRPQDRLGMRLAVFNPNNESDFCHVEMVQSREDILRNLLRCQTAVDNGLILRTKIQEYEVGV